MRWKFAGKLVNPISKNTTAANEKYQIGLEKKECSNLRMLNLLNAATDSIVTKIAVPITRCVVVSFITAILELRARQQTLGYKYPINGAKLQPFSLLINVS